jgi:predicted nucleic acid-binding protein
LAYVDTSAIIARYMPKDPMHKISQEFFSKKDNTLYITPLSLTELHSVLSRMTEQISLPKEVKIDFPVAVSTLVSFAIKHCNLAIAQIPYTVLAKIGELTVRAPIEEAMSYFLAARLKLRSLDLLHIALCWVLKMQQSVDLFVTIDDEIASKREVIREETGVIVKHLKEMIR